MASSATMLQLREIMDAPRGPDGKLQRGSSTAKSLLTALLFEAFRKPHASTGYCADFAMRELGDGLPLSTARQYRSQLAGALSYLRSREEVPSGSASPLADQDALDGASELAARYSLDRLYNAHRGAYRNRPTPPPIVDVNVAELSRFVTPYLAAASRGDDAARTALRMLVRAIQEAEASWART